MPVRVIDAHHALLSQSLKTINAEGFERVYVLKSAEEIKAAKIELVPIEADRRQDKGPFDIIGDVHGCYDELVKLLAELGYEVNADTYKARHPKGRQAVFLGDLVDLGPNSGGVLRLVMGMVERGSALCVPGNHENKLIRRLTGNSVKTTSGLDITLADLAGQSQGFRERVRAFLSSLVSHYVLDGGRLVVSHAGLPERYHGRRSDRVRQFCLYGETAGEFDGYGPSARLNWAEDYRGRALVVYGHVPVLEVRLSKNTVCLNTGCVFGGYLTAWRYPEGRTVQVKAGRVYCKPIKPLTGEHGTA
jgi:protein phosphatase